MDFQRFRIFNSAQRLSLYALIISILFILVFRATHIRDREISWDVFGYYLPLQATFVEGDPMLHSPEWIKETVEKNDLAGTTYFVSKNDQGHSMYFFMFGMSIVYSVFFLVGHVGAGVFGFAQDGLSPPYQYALIFGCIIYTIIGLVYLRKVLLKFVSDEAAAWTILLVVFATNYSHHMTLKNLETVNVLFMFAVLIIWNTIRWHEEFKLRNMLYVVIALAMMTLIKPSEILFGLVPLLWGVTSADSMKKRLLLWWEKRKHLILSAVVFTIILLPQMLYWKKMTGQFIYDSYKNPGVGLDLLNPHIIESLFSYRKGWFVYTPIMMFAFVGFYHLYRRKKELILGILIPFVIAFYIIVSWTEYWYGAGFSNRPVITQYALLAIPFAFFIQYILEAQLWKKIAIGTLFTGFLFLNQFQWWQLRNYILDPYKTTGDYYWAIFLKTSVDDEDRKYLLVNRDFSGVQHMDHPEWYSSRRFSFQETVGEDLSKEFSLDKKMAYHQLTDRDHAWVESKFEVFIPDSISDIHLVMKINRKEGCYGDKYFKIENTAPGTWMKKSVMYLTPEIRDAEDLFEWFVWNPKKQKFKLRNLEIRIHEENWRVIKK